MKYLKSYFLKFFLILLILFINKTYAFENNNNKKVILRIEKPSYEQVINFSNNGFDICSYKPGSYLDFIYSDDLSQLHNLGFQVHIIQTESEIQKKTKSYIKGYRTYSNLYNELLELEKKYLNICKLYKLDNTWGNIYTRDGYTNYQDYQHDILVMKVSDNVSEDEDEPDIYFMGTHHSRELISLEVTMAILYHLLENYNNNSIINNHISNKQIWFIPLLNPNGHKEVVENSNTFWRKNIRDNNGNNEIDNNIDGVDLNRNYGFQWGSVGSSDNFSSEVYHGPEPWSEPEVNFVKNFFTNHSFAAGISYHSYGELVLYPYGYDYSCKAPDHIALKDIAENIASNIQGNYNSNYLAIQSSKMYPVMGDHSDWAYGNLGIFSFTIELANDFIPSYDKIDQICSENIDGALALIDRLDYSIITGHVTDAKTGSPVIAEINIDGIDNTQSFRNPYKSEQKYGSYFRILSPGTYNISFIAKNYSNKTQNNIIVSNNSKTILDIELEPIFLKGDIDFDSKITINDALLLIKNLSK